MKKSIYFLFVTCLTFNVVSFSQPDLSVGILGSGYASYNQTTGEVSGVFFQVLNTGTAFSTPFSISLSISDTNFNNYPVDIVTDTNGLGGSSSETYTTTIRFSDNPAIPAGKYIITVCADSDSVITESTENNNCYFVGNWNEFVYTPNTVSLKEKTKDNTLITVYPNPTSQFVTFETNTKSSQLLNIYNSAGKIVRITTLNQLRFTIDISDLDAGLYYYNCGLSEGKFIVAKQ